MSAYENIKAVTAIAGSDLSSSQHLFGVTASDGEVDVVAAAGAMPDGVIGEAVTAGKAFPLIVSGVALVEVGSGGVTAGARVMSSATGTAVALGSTPGQVACGRALEAGSEGDIVRVLLGNFGQVPQVDT